MKYSIGLDLVVNNVGWAVYDFEKLEIIDKGVVRYKESSNAQDRRGFRASRRLNKRKHHRVERLAEVLHKYNFCTKRSYEPELLDKRLSGLNSQLSEQDIANIIYYFAIHRGYIPFDDEEQEREVHQFIEGEFPCVYIKEYFEKYNKYRGKCDLIELKDNIRELKAILSKQKDYHNKINDMLINEVIGIIESKREFWEGPGGPREDQLSKYGRYSNLEDLENFRIDPTYHKYLYELLIGKCDMSIDEIGNMDSVAPRYNFFAEEFNFLNDFINIRIKNPYNIGQKALGKINLNTNKLLPETIEEIKKYILTTKKVTIKKICDDIIYVDEDNIEGFRIDKDGKKEFSKFEMYRYIKDAFEKSNIKPNWMYDDDKQIYNKVIYVLTVSPSVYAIKEMLSDRIKEITFSEQEVELLKSIKKKKNNDLKYHALSEKLIIKAINDMKHYNCQYNFMQIMKKLEYEKEMNNWFNNNYTKKTKEPFFVEDKYVDEIIANPQVKKTLRKAIKVINAIIKQYNEYPYSIVVESTKEMNGREAKNRIINEQNKYQKLNKEAEEILISNGYSVNSKHIDLVISWLETNKSCAYCNKPISLNDLMKMDIEHILPESKTFDSSFDNITCSCVECNKNKGNRTAIEYLSSINLDDEFKKRVKNEYKEMSGKKKENLLFDGNIDKYSLKFINRNLRDTAYGTIALVEELKKFNKYIQFKSDCSINVISAPGQLTNKIRKNLEMTKDRGYLYHHAVDAMILASLADTPIGEILIKSQNDNSYWILIKNKKHQHIVWDKIKELHLKNGKQIKEFSDACDNQPEDDKEGLLKRSYEVLRNPLGQFADTQYAKFIKIKDEYYKISYTPNIYDAIIFDKNGKEGKDKKLFDKLFNKNCQTHILLCEEQDKKLYEMLKSIYESHSSVGNPFIQECLYKHGLEIGTKKFNYLIHGLRKNENSPIISKLRYIERVTNPYLKSEIKLKKKNKHGEFTNNQMKENTLIGLTSISQVCTKIFYSYTDNKFIFLPINKISFKNGKLDQRDKFYQETYERIIGNKNVKEISDVYCGEWIGAIKKNGEYQEGRFSCYHKTNKYLSCNCNGLSEKELKITSSSEAIIIYTTDILGNRYIRVDTRKLL